MNAMLPFRPENSHVRLQRGFAEAILFGEQPIPATIRAASGTAVTSRFGVYRNNVVSGLVNALAVRYPVTRKLLWPDSFGLVARMYVMAEPPRSPVLLAYGDGFPQFLRQVGEGTSADYLADVAELEAARTRAYHAAEAIPLSRNAFAGLTTDELPHVRLALHPSVSLLKSRFPVVTTWEANCGTNDRTICQWHAEAALIARPRLDVLIWRLPAGTYDFLTAVGEGRPVGCAIARAMEHAAEFDLAGSITMLIAADIVVGIERGRP